MILTTERLLLKPWETADAESLYFYAKDPDIGNSAGWKPHESVSESEEVIRTVLNGPECYAVFEKGSDRAIGSIELMLSDNSHLANGDDECELGFWLGKPFWGRGYMPEAAKELIRHGFVDLGMNKIWCGHYPDNAKSKRAQEKLGFAYYGMQERMVCDGVKIELVVNVLTRGRWEQRN